MNIDPLASFFRREQAQTSTRLANGMHSLSQKTGWAAAASLLLLSSCATYSPEPLDTDHAILAPPVAAALSADARIINRPYLEPVDLDLRAPLDRNAIAALAVINNPDLKAMRERAGVSDAQVFAAGLLPDPTFSAGFDHIISGPDPVDNIAAALGFDLSALLARGATRATAEAEARQVRLDLAWAEWQHAEDARKQALRVIALERRESLLEASLTAARSLLDRSLRAAGRGDYAADRVQSARLSVFDLEQRNQTLQADLAAARLNLVRLLGLPPDYPLRLAPPVPLASPPPVDTLLSLAIERRADLAALRAGYDAQEAVVRKAILDQFPNLAITLNGSRDTGRNVLVGPSIDLTLPLWNRNRGGIAIERATRAALRAEYEARLFQTRADIADAAAALRVALDQRNTFQTGLPALEQFAAANRRAADRGDLAQATAETAEQTLRDQQILLAEAEQTIAEQTIVLELATGAPRETWPR